MAPPSMGNEPKCLAPAVSTAGEPRKLIYILNQYSESEATHFYHVLGLLEALAARGVNIALVIEKGTHVPKLSSPNITVRLLGGPSRTRRLLALFREVGRLVRRGYRRTFVRIAAPAALVAVLANRLWGGAVYFWQSGTTIEFDRAQPPSVRKLKWWLGSHLPNALARRLTDVFVTGPDFMVEYYVRSAGVPRSKIRLLHNDVDVSRFVPDPSRQTVTRLLRANGISGDPVVLLLVHRLSPVRRTALYFPGCLERLARSGLLDRTATIVAGGGRELQAIRESARALGVAGRCIFLGDVPNREIDGLYAGADLFLHPSYNEGFPRVILEAMSAALPIVTTDAGGTKELLPEGQLRFSVSREDPESFAVAVEELVRSPETRADLGRANAEHVRRYSTPNVARMYEEVLFGQ